MKMQIKNKVKFLKPIQIHTDFLDKCYNVEEWQSRKQKKYEKSN